jgi:hypothetical protein
VSHQHGQYLRVVQYREMVKKRVHQLKSSVLTTSSINFGHPQITMRVAMRLVHLGDNRMQQPGMYDQVPPDGESAVRLR